LISQKTTLDYQKEFRKITRKMANGKFLRRLDIEIKLIFLGIRIREY
jgi:hypothetical protein